MGGGVFIYLRNTINYEIRDNFIQTNLEAVCVEINKPHSRPFVVITAYRPPNNTNDFFTHFEQLIQNIEDQNKEVNLYSW